jgi:DNA-binding transcriptional regulator YdaS (Cro superfamily)
MTIAQMLATLGTQTQAATRIGVSQTAVSSWVRGVSSPRGLAVSAIATAIGRPVDEVSAIVAAERAARRATALRVI